MFLYAYCNSMKNATIIHNPGSGDEEYSAKELIKKVEAEGFKCRYQSTQDDDWKDLPDDTDVLIIAGGDGTVRKVAKQLMNRKLLDKTLPLVLFPLGTANNIAKTLNVPFEPAKMMQALKHAQCKLFDVGRIYNIDSQEFFLESCGFGIFPYLMKKMKERDDDAKDVSAEEELQQALEMLHEIVMEYEPRECTLSVDGTDHSGKFILAEIMNIRSIGPNLELAPLADPGDGEFEVVLVPESQKSKFAAFIKEMIDGNKAAYTFHTLKGNRINIQWQGTHVHVDDKIVKIKEKTEVVVELKRALMQFLVTE